MTGEEIGKVAGGVVDGLKTQPALLAVVVMNVLMIGTLIWGVAQVMHTRTETMNRLIEQCGPKGG